MSREPITVGRIIFVIVILLYAKIHIINGKKGEFLAEKTNRKHKNISV